MCNNDQAGRRICTVHPYMKAKMQSEVHSDIQTHTQLQSLMRYKQTEEIIKRNFKILSGELYMIISPLKWMFDI